MIRYDEDYDGMVPTENGEYVKWGDAEEARKAEADGIFALCERAFRVARGVNWADDVDWQEVLKFAENIIMDIRSWKP